MKYKLNAVTSEALKYSTVGGIGYFVDVALFNSILLTSRHLWEWDEPMIAKSIATLVAIGFTYVANSKWTFRNRNGRPHGQSRVLRYLLISAIGLSFSLAALFVSREVLGLSSIVADNISANVVGVALAWIFRFFANRKWVFIERA